MPNRRGILRTTAAFAAALAASAPMTMTMTTITGGRMARAAEEQIETPPYEVIDRIGAIEIRQYGERLAAETDMTGPVRGMAQYSAFMALADFIFANDRADSQDPIAMTAPVAMQEQQQEPIAMTAPVATQPDDGVMTMRFFMPAKYTMETLPKPGNERVRIIEVPAQTLAVLRFSGDPSEADIKAQQERLLAGLKSAADAGAGTGTPTAAATWIATGVPGQFGYDAPGTPPEKRRNEVFVEVTKG